MPFSLTGESQFPFMVWMELEVNWPQASFVLCTGGRHFLLLFCSWCLFISQRLCVNMSIWIKHIVCIYCLLALLVRTIILHSMFTLPPAFLKLRVGAQNGLPVCFLWRGLEWCDELVPRSEATSAQFGSMKKSLRTPDPSCILKH